MGVKIVAELSANHNHDINIARQSIEAAKDVGADAIKIQTYTPDTMTIDCDNKYFQVKQGTIWDGITLFSLYQQAYTPWEWHQELFDFAREIGIKIFSTPFDKTAVDLLENLDCPIYKIASFEITDTPLIKYVASKGKPMIFSVGIATLEEIEEAVAACKSQNNNDITLLQCTSQYPANPEEAELMTMVDMKDRFGVKVGLSDHTMGSEVACIATAMGATLIEKHFILDREIGGPDAAFSMNQKEFAEIVQSVRRVEKIMGHPSYEMTESKKNSRAFARSLFVVEDVKKGELITEENVRSIRPGCGMSPKHLEEMLGKKFALDICKGTPLSWDKVTND
jgi:pseudaminic acid synthase